MNESEISYPFRITSEDFCRIFGAKWEEVPPKARAILSECDFRFRRPTLDERDQIVLSIAKRIDKKDFWISGEDKQAVWERGWNENLREFEQAGDLSQLSPKFLAAKKVLRLEGDWIIPFDSAFEFNLIDIYRRWAFSSYFSRCSEIYEFGCGSCQHIPVLAEMYPDATIHGLDWAQSSGRIIDHLVSTHRLKLKGHLFNLFEPDHDVPIDASSGVLTVGTLEQVGSKFGAFFEFLLRKRPQVVVHFESLRELYDLETFPDYLASRYSEERNYLSGYLPHLKNLAEKKEIKILKCHRVRFGSMFHDPYSMLVWQSIAR